MSTVNYESRAEKMDWLLRPLNWVISLSMFCGVFGFVYCYFGAVEFKWAAYALSALMILNCGLASFALARISSAAR